MLYLISYRYYSWQRRGEKKKPHDQKFSLVQTPSSLTQAVTRLAGVMSKAGFQTWTPGRPVNSSPAGLSSMGMSRPLGQPRSRVDIGIPI